MSLIEKIAMWAAIGFVGLFFIVIAGTIYIASKDLAEMIKENMSKGGKHGGK